MTSYVYDLPTTGAVAFSDFAIDATVYASRIGNATQARANLRGVLKQSRRTDGDDRDYLRIIKVLDDYIPQLRGIMACVQSGELQLKYEPVFSWRTTLSATLFNNSPRLRLPSLQADLASTLVTYAMALSNFSHSVITSLGAYEFEPAITDKERKEKDERLNFGVTLLCKASGVFSAISESISDDLDKVGNGVAWTRPPDLWREVHAALAKMALADAQSLAVRKLLSKAAFESTVSPGPPLPKSHPSTALIAKLHLDCAALYSSARTLAMAPSKHSLTAGLRASLGSASMSHSDGRGNVGEVSADLLKYLEKEARFHTAVAHKWLGVDAGETAKPGKGGEAVGFLKWAQQELEGLHPSRLSKGLSIGRDGANDQGHDRKQQARKVRIENELKSVKVYLEHYRKVNDSLTFDPVPKQSELQAMIPEGRMAVAAKVYLLPDPAFGPGSKGYQMRTRTQSKIHNDETWGVESLRVDNQANENKYEVVDDSSDDDVNNEGTSRATRSYVGAGSYF